MNTQQQDLDFLNALNEGAQTSSVLQSRLGVSQATLSRIVQRNRQHVLLLGAARSTQYARLAPIEGIGASLPVYQVDLIGNLRPFAVLHRLQGKQWGWAPVGGKEALSPSLPAPVKNMRPEGFMGKVFAQDVAADLGLPARLDRWNENHVLIALSKRGTDVTGNLVIGEEAAKRYLADAQAKTVEIVLAGQRESIYSEMADSALKGAVFGSASGGAQPKFTATVKGNTTYRNIVKFARRDTEHGARWSDLLILEHIANQVLSDVGFDTAKTEILQTEKWTFLESARFDREGLWGRSPLCSLGSLVEEYLGDTWVDAAVKLENSGLLSHEDVEAVACLNGFGGFVGNSDMHFGNMSLIPKAKGYSLAPVYDMTPMAYSPGPGGVIPQSPLEPDVLSVKGNIEEISALAVTFWNMGSLDTRISADFRSICSANLQNLKAMQNVPALKTEGLPGWEFF